MSFDYEGVYKIRCFSGNTLAETLREVASWLELVYRDKNGIKDKYDRLNSFFVTDMKYEYESEFSDSYHVEITYGVPNE